MKSKAGLVPAIHAFFLYAAKTWMPGSPSAKTRFALLPGHDGVKNSRHLVGFLPPRSSFNCQPFRTTRQEKTMTDFAETMPVSKPARWLGRVLSGLVIVFLLFDGAIKLVPWPVVTETMNKMGYGSSENLARSLGIITVVCTVLYSVPPTSILGAILLRCDGIACADRQPLVHPHAVRALSRPDGVGWVVAARPHLAQSDTLSR